MANTQLVAWGAWAGRRYGSFAGRGGAARTLARVDQARTHGAMAGRRYGAFVPRAGGTDFQLIPTAPVGLGGVPGISGNIGYFIAFEVQPPLAMATLGGAVALAGDLQIRRGQDIAQTAALGLSGALGHTGNLGVVITIAPSAPPLAGVLGIAGNVGYTEGPPFDVAAAAAIGMSGTPAIAGDLQSANLLDVVQAAPIALGGPLAIAGSYQITIDLAQTAALDVTAQMLSVDGDVRPETPFEVAQLGALVLVGVTAPLQAELQYPARSRGRRGERHHHEHGPRRGNHPGGGRKN